MLAAKVETAAVIAYRAKRAARKAEVDPNLIEAYPSTVSLPVVFEPGPERRFFANDLMRYANSWVFIDLPLFPQ